MPCACRAASCNYQLTNDATRSAHKNSAEPSQGLPHQNIVLVMAVETELTGESGLELLFPAGVLGWQLCCRSPCPQLWGSTQAVPGTDTQHGIRGDEAGAGTALVALGSGPWPWHGGTGRCGTCQECHSHRDAHSKNPQHTNRYN